MTGSRYRLSSGLDTLPENHSTPVMNITMDQDSINNRVRVRPGKKDRVRNIMIASRKLPSSVKTGHICWVSTRDHSSTMAANTRQRISMDRVLRIVIFNYSPRWLLSLTGYSA
jgi:hypothetical protein